MSNLSKTGNVDSAVDAAIVAAGESKPAAAKKRKVDGIAPQSFKAPSAAKQKVSAEAVAASGQTVGEQIVYAQANAFGKGVVEGAGKAMEQAAAAAAALIEEVDQEAAGFFQGFIQGD